MYFPHEQCLTFPRPGPTTYEDGDLIPTLPVGLVIADAEGRRVYVNQAWCRLAGMNADDALGDGWRRAIHPDDRDRVDRLWRESLASDTPFTSEYRYLHGDGTVVWVLAQSVAQRDTGGVVTGYVRTVTDVTPRKEAESALERSRRFFQSTLDAMTSHAAVLDEHGRIIAVNAAWRRFGATNGLALPEDGVGADYLATCERADGDDHADEASRGIRAVLSGRAPSFEMEYPCHGPEEQRWFILRVTRFAETRPVRVVVVHENITARRRAEAEREQLNAALNERVKELIGLHRTSELLHDLDRPLPEVLQQIVDRLPSAFQAPGRTGVRIRYDGAEYRNGGGGADGPRVWSEFGTAGGMTGVVEAYGGTEDEAYPFLPEEEALLESVAKMIAGFIDRAEAQQHLALRETRYRSLAQASAQLSWIADPSGAVTDVTHLRSNHLPPDAPLQGDSWLHLVHPDDRPDVVAHWQQCLRSGAFYEHRFRWFGDDGGIRHVQCRAVPVLDEAGDVREWIGTCTDVTDQVEAEHLQQERDHLRQAIEAHEKVLGVVGHELRTPLASIRAISEMLLTDMASSPDQFERFVQTIHDETLRMSDMVNDLLEVSRLNSGMARWHWSTFSVATPIEEAIASARPMVDATAVELDSAVAPADLMMRGDSGAVRRLILNLVNNAIKFTERGSILVTARPVLDGEAPCVELCVSDTGAGMSQATAEQLGEAFALNSGCAGEAYVQGSGLGLAICRGIAAAHGGSIIIESKVGRGTQVCVRLRADLAEPAQTDGAAAITSRVIS